MTDILIPVFNAARFLEVCVSSIVTLTPESHRIVLADDCSNELATQDLLDRYRWDHSAVVLSTNPRLGFAGNVNRGVRVGVSSEFFILLNSDIEVLPGWLAPLLEPLEQDPEVAIVGCKLLYPFEKNTNFAGRIQHAGVARYDGGQPYHIYRGEQARFPQSEVRREINAVTGACMAIRRRAWDELGGLDEEAFPGGQFEDIDLCWRARDRGWKVIYQPKTILYHYEHGSGEEFVARTHDHNRAALLTRWGHVHADLDLFM